MVSSGMLRRVALVKTDVSEELSASLIRVTRIGELGTTLAVTSNRRTLCSSETSVLTRAKRRNIPEDTIICSCFGFGHLQILSNVSRKFPMISIQVAVGG
jgi:hypothetical protein